MPINFTPIDDEAPKGASAIKFTPLDNDEETAGWGTALKSSFADVGNSADTAASFLASTGARMFGQDAEADDIFNQLDERMKSRQQWANPKKEKLGLGGKLAGTLATLPMQIATSGLGAATTGKQLLDAGESLEIAKGGGAIDAAGNAAGMLIPGFMPGKALVRGLTGAGLNAGQELLTKQLISNIAQTEQGKEQFAPTTDDAIVAGVIGGAAGAAHRTGTKTPKLSTVEQNVARIKAEREASTAGADAIKKAQIDFIELEDTKGTKAMEKAREDGTLAAQETLNTMEPDVRRATDTDHSAQRDLPFTDEVLPNRQELQGDLFGDQQPTPRSSEAPALTPEYGANARQADMYKDLFNEQDSVQATAETKKQQIEQLFQERAKSALADENRAAFERAKAQRDMELLAVEQQLREGAAQPPAITRAGTKAMMRVPKSQRGNAPIINDIANALIEKGGAIGKILKENYFTENMSGPDIVTAALTEGKDGRGINNLEAGSTLAAKKRRSTLIQEGSRIFQTAEKQADLQSRENVYPAEQFTKSLSKAEIKDLASVLKLEMFDRHKLTGDELLGMGMSEKGLKAYAAVRDMHREAFKVQNEARLRAGEKPITELEYYAASRWQGDFRRPVLDAKGNLKWYLAADSKRGLENQFKALQKQFPELVAGKDHQVRSIRGANEVKQILSSVIDVLGRDDLAVAKIQEWAEQNAAKEPDNALGQQKHFESKSNIRGFVGDRPGKDVTSEAIAMMQQQMTYAKNAFKWAELQKAADQMKEVLTNPDLLAQQPNNVAYMKDYVRNHMGFADHQLARAFDDFIRESGVSPNVVSKAVGGTKTLFIMQKMAVSIGFTASNVIQFVNNFPHMVEMSKNPLKLAYATASGIPLGMGMAMGHYFPGKNGNFYKGMAGMPGSEFLVKAMKYAEDNGVTSRSILDESPVANSFSVLGKVENVAGKTLSVPETILRSVSFMTYVQLLKQQNKLHFANDLELFRHAEETVNAAMGDYRTTERALFFSKAGTIGNALNTLQTYPINWYQQANHFTRAAKRGDVLPLAAFLGTQYMVAGAMGIPGFNDTAKLWELIKSSLPTEAWAKVKDLDLKEAMLRLGGQNALYGPLSTQSGVGLTSRVTAPSAADMVAAPGGPFADLGKQALSLGKLALDPTDKDKQTQAIMNSAPTGMQGLLETAALRDRMSVPTKDGKRVYRKTTDVADRQGMYARTPAEETIRAFGMRSQKEVFEKDMAASARMKNAEIQKRSGELPDKIYAAARNGDVDRTIDLMKLYTKLTGRAISNEQIAKQAMDEYTSAVQRAQTGAKTVEVLKNVQKMNQFLKEAQ